MEPMRVAALAAHSSNQAVAPGRTRCSLRPGAPTVRSEGGGHRAAKRDDRVPDGGEQHGRSDPPSSGEAVAESDTRPTPPATSSVGPESLGLRHARSPWSGRAESTPLEDDEPEGTIRRHCGPMKDPAPPSQWHLLHH